MPSFMLKKNGLLETPQGNRLKRYMKVQELLVHLAVVDQTWGSEITTSQADDRDYSSNYGWSPMETSGILYPSDEILCSCCVIL